MSARLESKREKMVLNLVETVYAVVNLMGCIVIAGLAAIVAPYAILTKTPNPFVLRHRPGEF